MNELQTVNHPLFGELPITVIEGKEFFGAVEAAKALGYAKPHNAISAHCREDGSLIQGVTDSLGREQQKKFINEGNLYRLIVRSKLPNAEQFEQWVFDEVLPTIRKTGGFVANEDLFVQTYLPTADEHTKSLFKVTLQTVRKLNETNAVLQPKADYFDALVDRNLLTNFRDTAKELKIREKEFIDWLILSKYVYRDRKKKLKPYAAFVPSLFEMKDWNRNGVVDVQTLITPKGKETFRLLLQEKQKA
jgi:prophage antirepressor-like protein